MTGQPESKVEVAKRRGRHLRGHHRGDAGVGARRTSATTTWRCSSSTAPTSRTTATPGGRSRPRGLEKAYSFMVRVAIPGRRDHRGAVSRRSSASPTRTPTARSGSPPARASSSTACSRATSSPRSPGINQALLTTISACGDVQRNVMGCAAPLGDADHAAVRARRRGAGARSCARPRARTTRSGSTARSRSRPRARSRSIATSYLPRKFKTAVGLSTDNCVDIWSQDVGLLAIVRRRPAHRASTCSSAAGSA